MFYLFYFCRYCTYLHSSSDQTTKWRFVFYLSWNKKALSFYLSKICMIYYMCIDILNYRSSFTVNSAYSFSSHCWTLHSAISTEDRILLLYSQMSNLSSVYVFLVFRAQKNVGIKMLSSELFLLIVHRSGVAGAVHSWVCHCMMACTVSSYWKFALF